jgi:hypothetical protein
MSLKLKVYISSFSFVSISIFEGELCSKSLTSLVILLKPSPCQGLCDENDPEVEDIGDVIGLCSGQFVSQLADIQSQATQSQALQSQATQSQANNLK